MLQQPMPRLAPALTCTIQCPALASLPPRFRDARRPLPPLLPHCCRCCHRCFPATVVGAVDYVRSQVMSCAGSYKTQGSETVESLADLFDVPVPDLYLFNPQVRGGRGGSQAGRRAGRGGPAPLLCSKAPCCAATYSSSRCLCAAAFEVLLPCATLGAVVAPASPPHVACALAPPLAPTCAARCACQVTGNELEPGTLLFVPPCTSGVAPPPEPTTECGTNYTVAAVNTTGGGSGARRAVLQIHQVRRPPATLTLKRSE